MTLNPTTIKTFWLASWEVQVLMVGTALATLTAADILPFLGWLPLVAQTFITSYWSWAMIALAWALRVFKTKSKLVLLPSEATPKEVVKEIVAADKKEAQLAKAQKIVDAAKTPLQLAQELVDKHNAGQDDPKA